MRNYSVSKRPRGNPRVLRTSGQNQNRRAVIELILQLAAQPHAARFRGLAIEDHQINAALICSRYDRVMSCAFEPLNLWQIAGGSSTNGQPHCFTGVYVVAVEQHV